MITHHSELRRPQTATASPHLPAQKGTATLRRTLVAVISVPATLVALFMLGPAAFGMPEPPDPAGAIPPDPGTASTPAVITVSHQSPLWVFVLVAAVSVAVTLAVVLTADRLRRSTRLRTAEV